MEIKQLLYAWNLVVGELTNSYSHLLNLFFFEFDILINELDLDILIVTSLHASTFDNNSIEFSQRQKKVTTIIINTNKTRTELIAKSNAKKIKIKIRTTDRPQHCLFTSNALHFYFVLFVKLWTITTTTIFF